MSSEDAAYNRWCASGSCQLYRGWNDGIQSLSAREKF